MPEPAPPDPSTDPSTGAAAGPGEDPRIDAAGQRPLVIGHRGDAGRAPENTMAAFRLALAAGARGIETDVQVSADGVAFLLHDEDLDRTTDGTGRADARTMADLQRVDAGAKAGPGFRGEFIPSLTDLARLCRGRAQLVLDLKAHGTALPIRAALAAADYPLCDVHVCAWHTAQAHEVRAALPEARLIYIDEAPTARSDPAWFEELRAAGYRGLSLAWSALSPATIRGARGCGLTLLTWTVNDDAEMRAAAVAGVDGIITDHPGTLARLLEPDRTR